MDEIIKQMNEVLDYLRENNVYKSYDGDTLTSGGIKLSLLKTNLGDMIADYEEASEIEEAKYGIDEANAYLKFRNEGSSIDDAKMKTKIELNEGRLELIKMKSNVRKLKAYHKNVTDVITNIQTKISYLKHERNEQQLNK